MLTPLGADAEFFCRRYNFAPSESALENHISNVQQDGSGFMWFATWNGLVRFDGFNFHAFQPILCSDGTIFSNRIYNIRVTSTGDIWCVSSDNLLFLFSRSDMRFLNIHSLIPDIAGKKVKVITPLRNGSTWITFRDNTAMRMNDASPDTGYSIFPSDHEALSDSRRINGIVLTDIGDEWILTDRKATNLTMGYAIPGNYTNVYSANGHNFLLGDDGRITRSSYDGKSTADFFMTATRKLNIRYSLYIDGKIITATDRGVMALDTSDGRITRYGDLDASYLYKDLRHRIWCFGKDAVTGLIEDTSVPRMEVFRSNKSTAAESGMKNPQLIFERPSGEIVLRPTGGVLSYFDEGCRAIKECLFLENDIKIDNYSPEGIKKYLVDDDSNLWVFHENGADCINFRQKYFDHVVGPDAQETRAIAVDRLRRYWIGGRDNTLRVADSTLSTLFYVDPQGHRSLMPVKFSRQPVYAITIAADSSVWIGTKGDGLYHLIPGSAPTRYSYHAENSSFRLPTDTIYDIKFSGNRIWIGSYGNGLSTGIPDSSGVYRFEFVKGQPGGMKIRSIYVDKENRLVIGTADGLVTADVTDMSAPRFFVNRFRADDCGLKGNDVMSVVSCGGKIYACVFGSGLSRIDSDDILSDSIRFTNFIIPSASSAGQIKTAVTCDDGIWVISEKSVSCFSSSTQLYTIYPAEYFMGHYSLSEATPVVDKGRIVTGTSDGLMYFKPAMMKSSQMPGHHISVTGIRYQNDMEIHPLNDIDSINLEADKRSFSLYLSAMKFGADHNIRFRYRIEGYDKGWNYASETHPEVTYNSLPPGEFTLIIESSATDGSWLAEQRKIHIYSEPKFTETTWFRVIAALIIVILILSTAYAALYFKRMRNEIQKKYSLLMTVENLSRNYQEARPVASRPDDEETRNRLFIEESVNYLNANLDNPALVVEDLARNAAMSRTAYFNRMKQITGLSPVDFIKQMRIKRAMSLLDDGNLPIADVAYRVGFTDPKYFSRCFKAEMGMTPTQYLDSRKETTSLSD